MAELQLRHTIEMDYLNALKDDEQRLRTLRMVEATTTDPKMKEWAKAEKEIIDTKRAELEQQRRDQEKRADDAEKKLSVAIQSGKIKDVELARLRADALRERAKANRLNEPSPPSTQQDLRNAPAPSPSAPATPLLTPDAGLPRLTRSSVLGAGEGWWCGMIDVSMCWRARADCVADRENGGEECEYVPHAFCFTASNRGTYCYRGEDLGCGSWASINGDFAKDKQTLVSKCTMTY